MITTIKELLDHYISRKPLASLTIYNYNKIVARFGSKATTKINLINEDTCLAWRAQLESEVSTATYNSYLRFMRALFSYAVEQKITPDNPFKRLYFSPQYVTRPKGITDKVYMDAIRYLETYDNPSPGWFWVLLVKIMAKSGMRARQAVSLQWCDMDWDNLIIHLRASGSKTRREWEIPLPASLIEPLQNLHVKSGAS